MHHPLLVAAVTNFRTACSQHLPHQQPNYLLYDAVRLPDCRCPAVLQGRLCGLQNLET